MQRREHEVAGERGLDARGHRLLVAHLADHDDVGVGAQEGRITAKSRPAFLFTCTWRRPFCVISTGSSAVQILVSGVFR
jgi:hypothetical protein